MRAYNTRLDIPASFATPKDLADTLAKLAPEEDDHRAFGKPLKYLHQSVAQKIFAAIAAVPPRPRNAQEWRDAANILTPNAKKLVCEDVFGWALVALSEWRKSNSNVGKDAVRERAEHGKNAKKALSRLIEWGWDGDQSVWRVAHPTAQHPLETCFSKGDRALFSSYLAREGGFDAIWSRGTDSEVVSLRTLGWRLAFSDWVSEFAEWAESGHRWAATQRGQNAMAIVGPLFKPVELWLAITSNRPQGSLSKTRASIEAIADTLVALDLLPNEAERAQLIVSWLDHWEGIAMLELGLARGFSLSDTSPGKEPLIFSALDVVRRSQGPAVLEFLLERGVDPLARNSAGLDALTYALAAVPDFRYHAQNAAKNGWRSMENLEGLVLAAREREDLQTSLNTASFDKEAEFGRWALALLAQGKLQINGEKPSLAQFRVLGAESLSACDNSPLETLLNEEATIAKTEPTPAARRGSRL